MALGKDLRCVIARSARLRAEAVPRTGRPEASGGGGAFAQSDGTSWGGFLERPGRTRRGGEPAQRNGRTSRRRTSRQHVDGPHAPPQLGPGTTVPWRGAALSQSAFPIFREPACRPETHTARRDDSVPVQPPSSEPSSLRDPRRRSPRPSRRGRLPASRCRPASGRRPLAIETAARAAANAGASGPVAGQRDGRQHARPTRRIVACRVWTGRVRSTVSAPRVGDRVSPGADPPCRRVELPSVAALSAPAVNWFGNGSRRAAASCSRIRSPIRALELALSGGFDFAAVP